MFNQYIKIKRKPTLIEALIPFIIMIIVLIYGKGVKGWPTEPLIILIASVAAIIAFRVGFTWSELMDEISAKVAKGMPAMLILISVGALVGVWRASGTVPIMIYYGVQIVHPQYLLVTTFIITAIVSIVTGTSWGSVGTMGVALIGIASGLGVSLPATAGAIIAGAYLGDKMSPLSDTTNLAPLVAGSELYTHIKHMMWTTIPASIISLIVYYIAGLNKNVSGNISSENINIMLSTLDSMYEWNWLLFVPAILILICSILKLPTIPVMISATALAGIFAITIQGISFENILKSMVNGFDIDMISAAGFDASVAPYEVTRLINGGGMSAIMETTLLVFCAYCFAGIMTKSGCLEVILTKLLSVVKSIGGLITATVISCITIALSTGNSYLSIIVPGELFEAAYKKFGLAPENLSRTLEDAGTVVVPLIPWAAAAVYMSSVLGVPTIEYLPWAVLCYTGFLFAIFYGFTEISLKKIPLDNNNCSEQNTPEL
ncbi:Na+/H+ antiporter NhaC [Candidatus Epulonipiscioides gigas]|nr:Na+/H+ antiporter NhaC [Epulopiscium sp. SCG-C07WGA-EpuloA2]